MVTAQRVLSRMAPYARRESALTKDPPWIATLTALEADVRYRLPPEPGDPGFRIQKGTLPVLLSAPHAAAHTRRGTIKEEDEYTAALARLLGQETGAHAIYTCCLSSDDANWDHDVPYKAALRELAECNAIRFVLDLHGCAGTRPFGLAIGTLGGRSCPEERELLLASLAKHGFQAEAHHPLDCIDIDRTFRAEGSSGAETITRYTWETLHISSAQLEIHPLLRIARRLLGASTERPFEGDALRIGRLVEALSSFLVRVGTEHPRI
jgi:hypothetical protein